MRYTITFREDQYEQLLTHLFSDRCVERAAYALCKMSVSEKEVRLLIREIIPVVDEDIENATETGMCINNRSFLRVMKQADLSKQVFLFIHSHPSGFATHSSKDDLEEVQLFKTAYSRIKTPGFHGSMVLSAPEKPSARIWLDDGTYKPVSMIRVIGKKFRFYSNEDADPLPQFFDRQIRAFGPDFQKIVNALHVGIIGLGGTGSAVKEQLSRLGVGKFTLIDGGFFEDTNINRVYGSALDDNGRQKVKIAAEGIASLGLQTKTITHSQPITFLDTAKEMKECDIVFGCTDDQWGRSILNKLAVYYSIPVFDMGVAITSEDLILQSIQGRVTTLYGGEACLSCRERIDSAGVEREMLSELDLGKLQELIKQGYAEELGDPAPSVIPFTTAVASAAVCEFIHRLTGFKGEGRQSNEVLLFFDDTRIRTTSTKSKDDCFCGDPYNIMRGDVNPILDIIWSR